MPLPPSTIEAVIAVTTIKVSYAPEHKVYAHQVNADTAVLQHLHDLVHGCGGTLFDLEPGGYRAGDYLIPALRTWGSDTSAGGDPAIGPGAGEPYSRRCLSRLRKP